MSILVTCEHGGNAVPARYASAFRSPAATRALSSHRGLDIGAADVARAMARSIGTVALIANVSRLVVDQNRSLGHRRIWSEFSKNLIPAEKALIVERYYLPHRMRVRTAVRDAIATSGRCVHVAVHSFAPELGGVARDADVGLLYDPARAAEATLVRTWRRALSAALPGSRIRLNYPYRGKTDGLTTALRREFPDRAYVGIELELNQSLLTSPAARRRIGRLAARTLDAERSGDLARSATRGGVADGTRRRRPLAAPDRRR